MNTVTLSYIITLVFLAIFTRFDLKSKRLPLKLVLVFGFLSVALYLAGGDLGAVNLILKAAPGLFFLAAAFMTRQMIGYGDGLVILFVGLLLDFEKIMTLVLAALVLSAIASIGILLLRKGNRESKLAFMPFLLAGFGVMLLW